MIKKVIGKRYVETNIVKRWLKWKHLNGMYQIQTDEIAEMSEIVRILK